MLCRLSVVCCVCCAAGVDVVAQGGDLKKYASAGIGRYVSADHALGSVRDAVDRYNGSHCDFPAQFIAADCHRVLLSRSLHPQCWFDLVSCQFALHYSCESADTASQFLWNVSERLLPGGHFIATFPDSERLMSVSTHTIPTLEQADRQHTGCDAHVLPSPIRSLLTAAPWAAPFRRVC